MAQRKLDPNMEAEMVAAYESWDTRVDGSVDELAARWGVTRQSLYRVLHKHGVPLHTRTPTVPLGPATASLNDELALSIGKAVLARLEELEAENAQLRRER